VHPHLIYVSLDQTKSTTQTAFRLVQPFLHSSWQSVIGHVLSPKNCPSHGAIRTPSSTWLLGPTCTHPQMASRLVQPCFCTAHHRVSLYFIIGRHFPLKIAHSHHRIWTPMVPWVHPTPQLKWHLDRFNRFCRAHYCDRPTDHATRSVTIGRI